MGDTGVSFSNMSPKTTLMVTITIPKPPAWKPAKPLILPADFWLPVITPNVPKSMFTTECSPWTLVILTVDFSSIPTSFPLLVLAIFLNKLLTLFPTQSFLPYLLFLTSVELNFPHYPLILTQLHDAI